MLRMNCLKVVVTKAIDDEGKPNFLSGCRDQ